jgi:hypothetical protein
MGIGEAARVYGIMSDAMAEVQACSLSDRRKQDVLKLLEELRDREVERLTRKVAS